MVILGSAVLFVFCFFLICFLILSSFGFSVCLLLSTCMLTTILLSTCMLMTIVNIQFLLIRFLAISFGEDNGTPLQYSCLENPMDGGAWWAAVHGVAKSQTWLSDFTFTFMHWRRKWQPTPVFLPGESQGWGRSMVGCHLSGRTESDMTEAT